MENNFYAITWAESYFSWLYWCNEDNGWKVFSEFPYKIDEVKKGLIDGNIYPGVLPSEIYVVGAQ